MVTGRVLGWPRRGSSQAGCLEPGELVFLRARLIAVLGGALVFVLLGVPSAAIAAIPRVGVIHANGRAVVVTFVGYDLDGSYGVEVSASRKLRDGHFADPVRSAQHLRLRSDLTQAVSFHGLARGTYFVRVSYDDTAAYRAYWARLCKRFGCTSPWHGQRVFEWSETAAFTVG